MASYHCSMKAVSRSGGRSAVAAAAYRAGAEITDERTGLTHDYTRKGGVVHAEVLLPEGGSADRAELWNAVEAKHKRGDAVVAREIEIALPAELTDAQRKELAVSYGREVADRYGVAVDVAIHRPSRDGDERNHHAHLLVSACHVDHDMKMGAKAVELDPIHCARNGLENAADQERARWATRCNEALERAGHEVRVDHRSLAAQREEAQAVALDVKKPEAERAVAEDRAMELAREPQVKMGQAATAMERRGEKSDRGEVLREVKARNRSLDALKNQVTAAKKLVVEATRAVAEKAREMASTVKAAVTKTFAKPAPAVSAEQREAQRIAGMTAQELREEIAKTRPEAVDQVVSQRPEIIEAAKASQALRSESDRSKQRLILAQREILDWEQQHPTKKAMHDKGVWKSAEYVGLQERAGQVEAAASAAERRLQAHERTEGGLWAEARKEVQQAQAPAWERVKRLQAELPPKEALERQERGCRGRFMTLAETVERGGPKAAKHLEAAPPEIRAKIAEHNALPKGDRHLYTSPRRQFVEKLSGPDFVKSMDRYQANAKEMGLERGHGHGMGR